MFCWLLRDEMCGWNGGLYVEELLGFLYANRPLLQC